LETVDTIFCCLPPDDRQYKINVIEFHNPYRGPRRIYINISDTNNIIGGYIASWLFQQNEGSPHRFDDKRSITEAEMAIWSFQLLKVMVLLQLTSQNAQLGAPHYLQ